MTGHAALLLVGGATAEARATRLTTTTSFDIMVDACVSVCVGVVWCGCGVCAQLAFTSRGRCRILGLFPPAFGFSAVFHVMKQVAKHVSLQVLTVPVSGQRVRDIERVRE